MDAEVQHSFEMVSHPLKQLFLSMSPTLPHFSHFSLITLQVCAWASVWVSVCVLGVCVSTCLCVYVYVLECVDMPAYMFVCVCVCLRACVNACVSTFECVCVCVFDTASVCD